MDLSPANEESDSGSAGGETPAPAALPLPAGLTPESTPCLPPNCFTPASILPHPLSTPAGLTPEVVTPASPLSRTCLTPALPSPPPPPLTLP